MTETKLDAPNESGLNTKPTTAAESLARIRRETPSLLVNLDLLLGTDKFPVLKICCQATDRKVHKLIVDETGSIENWYFIGDIHGDYFALHSLISYAESINPECRICFLGDIVDRGHMSLECVFLLLDWGAKNPGRLAWIAGNHDAAYSKVGDQFLSKCRPAEMLDDIKIEDSFWGLSRNQIGDFFVRLVGLLPRALLFPTGLLATHGGIPHTDLQKLGSVITDQEQYMDWLNSADCLEDFTWTRISSQPKKIPNRYKTGCQYGFRDFESFCDLNPEFFPVNAMVTGHEHAPSGYDENLTYEKFTALTLLGQGFSDRLDRDAVEFYTNYRETLSLGRGAPARSPDVLQVIVDRSELFNIYNDQIERARGTLKPDEASNFIPSPSQNLE